jgi:hypothetical protein
LRRCDGWESPLGEQEDDEGGEQDAAPSHAPDTARTGPVQKASTRRFVRIATAVPRVHSCASLALTRVRDADSIAPSKGRTIDVFHVQDATRR